MCGVPAPSGVTTYRAAPTDLGFEVVSLRDDIHVLHARSTFWPAPGNILVIEDEQGIALLDCSFGTEQARDGVAEALATIGLDIAAVHTVLVTHPHLDHAGGIGLLPEHVRVLGPALLGTQVADARATAELIFPTAARELAPEREHLELVEHFRTDCGVARAPVAVNTVEHGDVLKLGRTRWEVVSTPGHEDGMFSYFEPEHGILFCSDILASKGTAIPWYAPGGGGTGSYLAGLDRLALLEINTGVRGHGDLIFGAASVSESVADTAHRIRRRTTTLREVLATGPRSFADLEQHIYDQRVYDVIPWAASVLATHLLEGIEDGTVRREGDLFMAVGA